MDGELSFSVIFSYNPLLTTFIFLEREREREREREEWVPSFWKLVPISVRWRACRCYGSNGRQCVTIYKTGSGRSNNDGFWDFCRADVYGDKQSNSFESFPLIPYGMWMNHHHHHIGDPDVLADTFLVFTKKEKPNKKHRYLSSFLFLWIYLWFFFLLYGVIETRNTFFFRRKKLYFI